MLKPLNGIITKPSVNNTVKQDNMQHAFETHTSIWAKISELQKERRDYAKCFGLKESFIVYNPLIECYLRHAWDRQRMILITIN